MLYVFMLVLLIIPMTMEIYVIWNFVNYEKILRTKRKLVEKPLLKGYVNQRCRNFIRGFKSISEFYEIESNIKYP